MEINIAIKLSSGKEIKLSEEEYNELLNKFKQYEYIPYPSITYPSITYPCITYPLEPYWNDFYKITCLSD